VDEDASSPKDSDWPFDSSPAAYLSLHSTLTLRKKADILSMMFLEPVRRLRVRACARTLIANRPSLAAGCVLEGS
jgi:hypothetical protein